jgi:hypothetical protein
MTGQESAPQVRVFQRGPVLLGVAAAAVGGVYLYLDYLTGILSGEDGGEGLIIYYLITALPIATLIVRVEGPEPKFGAGRTGYLASVLFVGFIA